MLSQEDGMTARIANLIDVSPEMVAAIGPGEIEPRSLPSDSALFGFALGRDGSRSTVRLQRDGQPESADEMMATDDLVFVVKCGALQRLFEFAPDQWRGHFHLSHDLAAIALSLLDDRREVGSLHTYRLAKSIELLCECVAALKAQNLVPVAAGSGLGERDARAIVAARAMIDAQWSEKLTLETIARACGINRAKLTRGFRAVYRTTIAEALAERRLAQARAQLITTDLPVSSIGYASGYLNNASFARAFGRRYGVSPSDFRATRSAA